MTYVANILADSISPEGVRLTTFGVVHPRLILAEENTHRMVSKNSESSRAVKPEIRIANLMRGDMFIPETLGSRVKGMGYGTDLDEESLERALQIWKGAGYAAADHAHLFNETGADKSRTNRMMEPFLWHHAIYSSTEWDNFWALRCPLDGPVPNPDHPAQPEFQISARMMLDAYRESTPKKLGPKMWALPLVTPKERRSWSAELGPHKALLRSRAVSISRCARVSYAKHAEAEDLDATLTRYDRLRNSIPPHLSPFEHVARPFTDYEWEFVRDAQALLGDFDGDIDTEVVSKWRRELEFCGNFRGWVQERTYVPHEHNALELIPDAKQEQPT